MEFISRLKTRVGSRHWGALLVLFLAATAGPSMGQTPTTQAADPSAHVDPTPARPGDDDLRSLIAAGGASTKRGERFAFPAMSLRGFIQIEGKPPMALLEIEGINRTYLVQANTEVPITVMVRSAASRGELSGLGLGKGAAPARSGEEPAQIIITIDKVTAQGITAQADPGGQIIVIR